MKIYDGADWITMYTIDTATNTIDYSDASVSMPGISTSATVTVLTLADGSILLNPAGYVSVGGKATQAGEIRFLEDTNDGANYIALKGPTGYGSNVTYILPTVDGSRWRCINNQCFRYNVMDYSSFRNFSRIRNSYVNCTLKMIDK